MKRVNELLTPENSFFGELKNSHGTLYATLFEDSEASDLDMQILVECGERYAAPLLTHYPINRVVNFIVAKYGESWKRIKAALTAEYEVLKPYNITTKTTGEKSATNETASESEDKTGIVGFDAEVATDNTVDSNTHNVKIEQGENTTTTVESSGNNGNITNQNLITNEIEVRKNSFVSLVVNDIQTQITLDIY